jgi:hypothetical protein
MVAAMRVADDEEGKGGKAMAMGTRVAGEQRRQQRQQCGRWRQQQGWWDPSLLMASEFDSCAQLWKIGEKSTSVMAF